MEPQSESILFQMLLLLYIIDVEKRYFFIVKKRDCGPRTLTQHSKTR